MKNSPRTAVLLSLVSLILIPVLCPAETTSELVTGSAGAAVRISPGSPEQGDILLLTLDGVPAVREVVVNFLGRDLILRSSAEGGAPLAFVGVDFAQSPGPRRMRVEFRYADGTRGTVLKTLFLRSRTFRSKRLQLPEQFVEPPPEALERIARDSKLLAAVYAVLTPRWLGDGRFVVPHAGPMRNNFGERRILNDRKKSVHAGLDIDAALGDPIVASNAGKVVLAEDLYYSGNTVILDHGLGVFTIYLHMSKLLVRTGDSVAKAAVLGEAGSTGRSAGPHLHWAVKVFDSRVDPQALLRLPLDSL